MSKKIVVTGWVAGLLMASLLAGAFQERQDAQDPDSRSLRDFMRTKLNYTQALVEGLSLKNFDLIRDGATEIRNVTEGTMWLVHKTPEYNKYSDELKRSVELLILAAENRNLEAATLRYFDMTLKCIDCHEYLRTIRL